VAALAFLALALWTAGGLFLNPFDRVSSHNPNDQIWFEWLLEHGAYTVRHLDERQRQKLDPAVLSAALEGERLTALDYLNAEAERVALAEAMAQYHRRFDLLLTPTTAEPAPLVDAPLDSQRDATPFAYPFSLTRQPAISVPNGTTAAGLPIGLQIVGRPFEDGLVLAAADAFQSRFGERHAPA